MRKERRKQTKRPLMIAIAAIIVVAAVLLLLFFTGVLGQEARAAFVVDDKAKRIQRSLRRITRRSNYKRR